MPGTHSATRPAHTDLKHPGRGGGERERLKKKKDYEERVKDSKGGVACMTCSNHVGVVVYDLSK